MAIGVRECHASWAFFLGPLLRIRCRMATTSWRLGGPMPVYVYRNLVTNETFEHQQPITDDPLTVDPRTGDPVKRVIQPVGIAFKGSGFYVNDSKAGSGGSNGSSAKSGDAKSDVARSEVAKSEPVGSSSGSASASSTSAASSD